MPYARVFVGVFFGKKSGAEPCQPFQQASSSDQAEFIDHDQAGKQNGHQHISPAAAEGLTVPHRETPAVKPGRKHAPPAAVVPISLERNSPRNRPVAGG